MVIDSFKEEGALRRIEATILVERDSQKAIVIGEGGERLKRIATAARQDMERLFGGKVYLGVWVKVKQGLDRRRARAAPARATEMATQRAPTHEPALRAAHATRTRRRA